jgi:hypothetical protein
LLTFGVENQDGTKGDTSPSEILLILPFEIGSGLKKDQHWWTAEKDLETGKETV